MSRPQSSVHPLVPLLLYSDRHFPPSSPYTQPIGASGALPRTHPCCHGNVTTGTSTTDHCYDNYCSVSLSLSVSRMSLALSSRQAVKKPLNAFMLYMKETRHSVLQEGRERESAAINRILGRRWHALSRSEQSKYYDLARKERLLHMQLVKGRGSGASSPQEASPGYGTSGNVGEFLNLASVKVIECFHFQRF
ncbi:hypothetical protein F2P81_018013 [Scophthalmus maximus]|uniref:HMG box domain-containing protein n=1 Tax=Scophthalmus maximus TaxID=52904 RepID=A0A6A4S9H6_SCOMX|nr:hypothetical protein F2P81_018013 [Scophthalmus maximus]